ncbi:maleylpyruvate isomerase family mycothiol-dependent enzyme [Blastococcus sp. PRF04-17]|uniref:maleylpyruvate isomerase family mycothiol-dependent enzyme n=1 Tax=Blastococcus sp. PRF04-17 TaxID=2933797 RepID=UPI001FF49B1F|nr:maleylpyruvate isomerase family mycothiol-dependent enzyme [Blastococcus sp. PRF04-17]UOY00939.1 maleylpyruvate isomerase family mycothiol-dependent enzyme [Blastococcus sp. PRF04-17]
MTTPVDEALRQRCVEAVVEEGERVGILAQQLEAGLTAATDRLDTTVPWVPGWTARDLVGHLGTVHRWATAILRAGRTDPPLREAMQTPPPNDLIDWYGTGLAELVTALRTTPPDAPAWHMSPTAEKTARSWARRQAHELAVHRMDLEAAAGTGHAPLDPALAEDGVDELLTVVVPRWAHTAPLSTADAVVTVTATDTGRRWTVRVDRGHVTVTAHPPSGADAHLAGDTTQLLLRLWGRPAAVTVEGDPASEALLRGR